MPQKITKALIPAAGFGTRFLPQTKAMPKEMMPLVDKPIIQRVVEELVEAGIETIVIVTGWHKRSIEDHFDNNFELERKLEEGGKDKELEIVRHISNMAEFVYIRQKGPMGNATPILNAKHIMRDDPFIMLWGDEFVDATPNRTQQLISAYEKYQTMIVGAIEKDGDEDYKKYGYAGGEEVENGVIKISRIVEKPKTRENAPSNLATNGGYVITPEIYTHLENAKQNLPDGEELVYVMGMQGVIDAGGAVHAVKLQEASYCDTGNKLEYLKTVVRYGIHHEEFGEEFRDFLKSINS
jgi:UTP--glucose-1-phosphate uridylyltransferase